MSKRVVCLTLILILSLSFVSAGVEDWIPDWWEGVKKIFGLEEPSYSPDFGGERNLQEIDSLEIIEEESPKIEEAPEIKEIEGGSLETSQETERIEAEAEPFQTDPIPERVGEITPDSIDEATTSSQACFDSDGKDNFLKKGFIDFDGQMYNDYCERDIVYDYYCEEIHPTLIGKIISIIGNVISGENSAQTTFKDCKFYGEDYKCIGGGCMKETVVCEDDDEGRDYYVKGRISGESAETKEYFEGGDYCEEGNLIEYYCNDVGKVSSEIYKCDSGCSEGKCSGDVPAVFSRGGGDYAPMQNVMIEAEKALNVKGFDAASAVGATFSDTINPYSGALTITQTDVLVLGRHEMNIQLARQYSSNIFLHINQDPGSEDCIYSNDICSDCQVPDTLEAKYMLDFSGRLIQANGDKSMKCNPYSFDKDPSSYIRPRFLGLGWTMDPGKIQDPTSLLFKTAQPEGVPTYEYISSRGVNSLNMVVDNNANSLITPSMYRHNDVSPYTSEDLTGLSDSSYVNCAEWSTNVGNPTGMIDSYSNAITNLQNLVYQSESSGAFLIDNTFTAYTNSLEPVFLSFYPIPTIMSNTGEVGLQQANYHSKNGKTYFFGHYVSFCGKFDDMRNPCIDSEYATCSDLDNVLVDCNDNFIKEKLAKWAENPYSGNYLEYVIDNFGNRIIYTYVDYEASGGDNAPFIRKVSLASGKYAEFKYMDKNSVLDDGSNGQFAGFDINTRLKYIEFTGPTGNILYRIYEYDNQDPTLLVSSYVAESENGPALPGTKYEFKYGDSSVIQDKRTKELTSVKLPTGAEIDYTYAWSSNIPVNELTRFDGTDFGNTLSRRVVAIKSVKNGGSCPQMQIGPDGGKVDSGYSQTGCVWLYQYEPVPGESISVTLPNQDPKELPTWEMKTTVYDPFGGRSIYYSYPATQNSITTQYAFGQWAIDAYPQYVCDVS